MSTGGFSDLVNASNGGLLMFLSADLGGSERTAEDSYNYFWGEYSIGPGWYVNGPPTMFDFPYFPFTIVIDLNTGEILGRDGYPTDDTYLSGEDILNFVAQANGE